MTAAARSLWPIPNPELTLSLALSALDSDVQGCGISMDMGIDVQGYVDLVQLLSGINN